MTWIENEAPPTKFVAKPFFPLVHHLTLLDNLKETFANLREYQINLNPEKYVFSVPPGQLRGFLVSERGIEANPEKIKAIERVRKPA